MLRRISFHGLQGDLVKNNNIKKRSQNILTKAVWLTKHEKDARKKRQLSTVITRQKKNI